LLLQLHVCRHLGRLLALLLQFQLGPHQLHLSLQILQGR